MQYCLALVGSLLIVGLVYKLTLFIRSFLKHPDITELDNPGSMATLQSVNSSQQHLEKKSKVAIQGAFYIPARR